MQRKWTRERIIRQILEREAQGLPLTVGGRGVGQPIYAAARRIFGSWPNAIQAAGIQPQHAPAWERWSPARILMIIRRLAQRKRPLNSAQLKRRYGNLMHRARRHFGSWTKAVLAAGVDPTRLQRAVPWTRERVMEAILTRALRNETLVGRLIEPRSLVEAGHRFFGGWSAAVMAAGLDSKLTLLPRRRTHRPRAERTPCALSPHLPRQLWTKEMIITAIHDRLREQKPLHPAALAREDRALSRAIRRHLKSWSEGMRAAGLDPAEHLRRQAGRIITTDSGPREHISKLSQANEALRPDHPA